MQVFLFHNYIIEFTYFVLRHISFNFLFKKQDASFRKRIKLIVTLIGFISFFTSASFRFFPPKNVTIFVSNCGYKFNGDESAL